MRETYAEKWREEAEALGAIAVGCGLREELMEGCL
jgi:hypothetical protein